MHNTGPDTDEHLGGDADPTQLPKNAAARKFPQRIQNLPASPTNKRIAARAYAKEGFRVFPLHWYAKIETGIACSCGNPGCTSVGKHPLIEGGRNAATTDTERIDEWWSEWPDANIGIATGDGLVVLDVDTDEGRKALQAEKRKHGMDETAAVMSRRGFHLYYRVPEGESVKSGDLFPGVEVKADRMAIVAPPSTFPPTKSESNQYELVSDGLDILEAPQWLIEQIRDLSERDSDSKPDTVTQERATRAIGLEGAQKAFEREIERVREAPEGERNPALNTAAFNLGQIIGAGLLDEADVREALQQAASDAGLEESEIGPSIASGLKAGKAKPRPVKKQNQTPTRGNGKPEIFTAQDLEADELRPLRWIVENIVPEGLTILAGAPKLGKSFLAQQLSLAVATGGDFAGIGHARQGCVLYLALEDGKRRLRTRQRTITDKPDTGLLHYALHWDRLDREGVNWLNTFLTENSDCRLVVVDVFAKVRKPSNGSRNAYDEDYEALNGLKQLAEDHGAAIVVLHHTRKSEATDVLHEVSGSTGLTGCADTVMVLQGPRGSEEATLILEGRDVPHKALALSKDENGVWSYDGPATVSSRPEGRQKILDVIRDAGKPLGPKAIADATGLKLSNVKNTCRRMADDYGELERAQGGRYVPVDDLTESLHGVGPEALYASQGK